MSLAWSEQTAVDELTGALMSVAALIRHRPDVAGPVRAAVVAELGDDETALIAALTEAVGRAHAGAAA